MACANPKIEAELPLTCCLGDHPLQNPRLLPCQHSVCIGCIKAEVEQERKMFICPKCQLSIPMTKKDVDQLPEDVLYHIMQETKTNNDCVLCKFEDKKSIGTFQCLDCADVLCDQCQKGHTRSSQTRLHRVVPVKDIKQQKTDITAEKRLFCDTHSKSNKPMVQDYYCEECKSLVCQLCALKEHQPQGHTCNTIGEIHNEKMAAVTDHVTKLLGLRQHVVEFTELLQQELERNIVCKDELENEVYDRATKFIEIIEKIKEETLKSIKGHFDTANTSIRAKLTDTKNRIIRIDNLVSYTQAFIKHSAKSQFLKYQDEMITRLVDQKVTTMDISLKTKSFELGLPQYAETETFLTKAFGTINFKKLTITSMDVLRTLLKEKPQTLFKFEVGLDNVAADITIAENGDIFALSRRTIHRYSKNGDEKEAIQCSLVEKGWNVVAKSNTLYVSNSEGSIPVVAMDFQGNVKKTICLPSEYNEAIYCKGLAVDNEDNVYISANNAIFKCKQNDTKATVFIQERENEDLQGSFYLCVTPAGDLVVSNCYSDTIQVYDKQGELLWNYKGQGHTALQEPFGVSCDRNNNIYICDSDNDRVQVIRDGNLVGEIKLEGFRKPTSLCIDEDGNIVCGFIEGMFMAKLKVWE